MVKMLKKLFFSKIDIFTDFQTKASTQMHNYASTDPFDIIAWLVLCDKHDVRIKSWLSLLSFCSKTLENDIWTSTVHISLNCIWML